MSNVKTAHVPHLWGTEVGYQMPRPYDPSKPTCILINSFTMTSDLYAAQFQNEALLSAMNLLAVEPYGHGQTRTSTPTFTYWDTSIMTLQLLTALSIQPPIFALGTSQGGWIAVRMALLQPERLAGTILLGTSLDSESERTRALGNFNAIETLTPVIQSLEAAGPASQDWSPPDGLREFPIYTGFGRGRLGKEELEFWWGEYGRNYRGEEGRRRYKECAINLRDRDGLLGRLFEVRCPVLWLHGTEDAAYSVANAREEIGMLVNSSEARLQVVEGGQHYLNASHPEVVDEAVMGFVKKYS